MDIGKSFSYVFEDPKWMMKILIGGIVAIVPIVNFAAIGYMLATMKNVADGQANPLPEWGEFGAHFMKGLYAVVGALVYFAPMILLYCCIFVLSFAGSAMAGSGSSSGGDTIGTVLGLVTVCIQCIAGLYALVAGVTLYAPMTRFAMSDNKLAIFWDFRTNFDFIMKNLTNYIIALLIAIVGSFVAGFGIILCVVGVFFTTFWSYLVTAHVFGQFWRDAQSKGTAPAV
ncbi:MAG: DUF4013 domain-containing protein [Chloroflexi bacterium]|nr:DUF4013 domain-containing protein [Chloroflexota bacterium]